MTNDLNVLVAIIKSLKSAQEGDMVTQTEVKLNKKHRETKMPNPFSLPVRKLSYLKIEVNSSYQDKVNDGRLVEGKDTDFSTKDNWGEHDECEGIIKHDDKLYLQYIRKGKNQEPVYLDAQGNLITFESLVPYMPPVSDPKHQMLDQPVRVRRVKLENILGLALEKRPVYLKP